VLKADCYRRINAKKGRPLQDCYAPCSLNARTVDDINLRRLIEATENVSLCGVDEKLRAFVELEAAICVCGELA
jgi:hypothetical protein